MNKPYKLNGREVTYGSFEELQEVASTVRKYMFDYIMGKIDKRKFLSMYYEFEVSLLEHEYVSADDPYFDMDLPDEERFLAGKG